MKGFTREVQIRRIIKEACSGKAVLVELEAPRPGLQAWFPLRFVRFGASEYASSRYEHRVMRIPDWLWKQKFENDEPMHSTSREREDKIPF